MQKIRASIKKYLKTVDKWILLFCIFLSTLSVLLLYSLYQSNVASTLRLSERTCIVQLAAMFMGLTAAVIISNIDYPFYSKALEAVHTGFGFPRAADILRRFAG